MIHLAEKKILVTGGAGFLGSAVVNRLRATGCTNIIVPRSSQYDLREKSAILQLLTRTQPEIIVHLAATVGGIGANQKYAGRYFFENAMMCIQLMEYARQFKVEKFVGVGTICSYPKFTPVPFKESDLWSGYPEETNAPYGMAKKMMIVQGQAYRQQYGFNAISLLLVNLFGPRDNFDLESSHVIPALIRKCVEAKEQRKREIVVWGDGTPTREFLYVDDAAEGIVMATESYDSPEPVNLGSGKEITIRDLALHIASVVGYEGTFVWDTNRPNGQPRRCLDVSRARESFGFAAHSTLREGIEKTIAWYLAHRKDIDERLERKAASGAR